MNSWQAPALAAIGCLALFVVADWYGTLVCDGQYLVPPDWIDAEPPFDVCWSHNTTGFTHLLNALDFALPLLSLALTAFAIRNKLK